MGYKIKFNYSGEIKSHCWICHLMLFVEYCILFKFSHGLNNVFASLIFLLFRIFPRIIPKLCGFHMVFDSYSNSFPRGAHYFENHKKN